MYSIVFAGRHVRSLRLHVVKPKVVRQELAVLDLLHALGDGLLHERPRVLEVRELPGPETTV